MPIYSDSTASMILNQGSGRGRNVGGLSSIDLAAVAAACVPPELDGGGRLSHHCITTPRETKCYAMPSVIPNLAAAEVADGALYSKFLKGLSRIRNPMDFRQMGDVALFRRTMDEICTLSAWVNNNNFTPATSPTSTTRLITFDATDIKGPFLGVHVVLTGELAATSSSLFNIKTTGAVSIAAPTQPTDRSISARMDILTIAEFFIPFGTKQDYNPIGRPVISTTDITQDIVPDITVEFSNVGALGSANFEASLITPETWSMADYSASIEFLAMLAYSNTEHA